MVNINLIFNNFRCHLLGFLNVKGGQHLSFLPLAVFTTLYGYIGHQEQGSLLRIMRTCNGD